MKLEDKILIDIKEVMKITGLEYDSAASLIRDTNAYLKKQKKEARTFRGKANRKLLLQLLGEGETYAGV
ncbi:hypothetical protein A2U13_08910 [Fusobacterium necrophorum subsp. funduliforme]|uniref:hypothetical protein n=1 Tax=Fusobacterium necrophorum TaxID=859 RepID=UPI000788CB7B|nr:hypothetical protein [Fusobacterium necrophorum]KYM67135.1 hypothetical protein A2U13_08910 [Fusobacterium necrophorum subsp. funduliforme]